MRAIHFFFQKMNCRFKRQQLERDRLKNAEQAQKAQISAQLSFKSVSPIEFER
jgi:hypothetical protein